MISIADFDQEIDGSDVEGLVKAFRRAANEGFDPAKVARNETDLHMLEVTVRRYRQERWEMSPKQRKDLFEALASALAAFCAAEEQSK